MTNKTISLPPENTNTWVDIADNTELLNQTRSLLESRQFAVAESMAHLTDRTKALRAGVDETGIWGEIRQDKGRHSSRSFYQTAITLGADRTEGISTTGIMGNINQGHDSGNCDNCGREEHTQAGIGIYNSLGHDEGLFLDSALSYQLYHQTLKYSPELADLPSKSNSNIVLLGTRLGYTIKYNQLDAFIEPLAGIDAAYMEDYKSSNDTVSIHQKSGYPVNAVFGVRVGKHWRRAENSDITLTTGIVRQQSVGNSAPGITLSDAYKVREYPSKSDNRYRFDVELKGNLGNNMATSLFVANSRGGDFNTDYSGRFILSYSFR